MEFFRELWAFMRARRRFWLVPIIVVLLSLGAIIVFAEGSMLAPFLYPLF